MDRDSSPQRGDRPTFHSRQVVELADEYAVTNAQMLAICDRLGVEASDAASWINAPSVEQIRQVVAVGGPDAVLGRPTRAVARTLRRSGTAPELGSVQHDEVRTRRAIVIALCIGGAATVAGVLITVWLNDRHDAHKIAPVTAAAAPPLSTMSTSVAGAGARHP